MIRLAPIAASLTLAMLTPATAQTGAHFVATPVEAPTRASFVTQNTLWKCAGNVCVAPKAPTKDKVMCERAVQRLGALSAFTVAGTPFDAQALAACNARAK
jgi:hypothetical protein